MSQLRETLQKLHGFWAGQGIRLEMPVAKCEVEQKIAATGKRISYEVIELYSTFGGMSDQHMDDACLSIWPLDFAVEQNQLIDSPLWFFGDHLIHSNLYASKRANDTTSTVLHFFHDLDGEMELAASMKDFFGRYYSANNEGDRLRVIL